MANEFKSYVNIPMTEEQARRVAEVDDSWTGPKLVILCAVTLFLAMFLLWAAAWRVVGPDFGPDAPPLIQWIPGEAPAIEASVE